MTIVNPAPPAIHSAPLGAAKIDDPLWLARFLTITTWGNLSLSVITLSVAWYWQLAAIGAAGLVFLAYNGVLLIARRLARQGQIAHVGALLCISIQINTLLIGLTLPEAGVALLLGPLCAIIFSLPFLTPTALRRMTTAAWGSTLILLLIIHSVSLFPPVGVPLHMPLMIATLHVIGMILLMLRLYHARLADALARSRSANEQLRRIQAGLEETVATRTAELQERETRLRLINAVTNDYNFGVRIHPDGGVTTEWLTESFTRIVGYTPDDLAQRGGFRAIIHPDDELIVQRRYERVLANQIDISEFRIINASGQTRWLRASTHPIWSEADQRVTYAYGGMQDITQRKEYEQQIERMAFVDDLTGLANRAQWRRQIELAVAAAAETQRSVAVLFLDLNRFKAVNDTLGHDVGDMLLVAVAQRLQRCTRPDQLLARLGGDEFALLLPGADEAEARAVAEQIGAQFSSVFAIDHHLLHVGCSIGVACAPRDGSAVGALMQHADIAMYHAKQRGLLVEAYRPEFHVYHQERLRLEADLRQAIDRRAFVLYYQPILNLTTDTIDFMEALVRWEHPEHGLIAPSVFIPIAEESGLIRAIDQIVILEAMAHSVRLAAAGATTTITVNLSAASLQDAELVAYFRRCLDETGAQPQQLLIEITESSAMSDLDLTVELLHELRRMGFRVAIDDFGRGYASLTYLRQLPIDVLKMDRMLAWGIGQEPRDEALFSALIALGRGLQITVVAEGIERQEQLDWLRRIGCDHVQGYLIGRPSAAERLCTVISPFPQGRPPAADDSPALAA